MNLGGFEGGVFLGLFEGYLRVELGGGGGVEEKLGKISRYVKVKFKDDKMPYFK